jgi:CBS domain-containing protein
VRKNETPLPELDSEVASLWCDHCHLQRIAESFILTSLLESLISYALQQSKHRLSIGMSAKRSSSSSSQTDNKVSDIASTAFVSLDGDTLVAEAAKALYEQETCTIIVTHYDSISNQRVPIGIVTERDIIFRVVAQNKGPFKITLKDIMSSPIITIDSDKSDKEALVILKQNGINRLPVVNKGNLIGLVTTEMIARKSV